MIPLTITANIDDDPWTELRSENAQPGLGTIIKIGRLPRGTEAGKSTISVLIEMPDGSIAAAQTTMALMASAMQVLQQVDLQEG
jgi:hypothetical protein